MYGHVKVLGSIHGLPQVINQTGGKGGIMEANNKQYLAMKHSGDGRNESI